VTFAWMIWWWVKSNLFWFLTLRLLAWVGCWILSYQLIWCTVWLRSKNSRWISKKAKLSAIWVIDLLTLESENHGLKLEMKMSRNEECLDQFPGVMVLQNQV
jgi:hypothetical protein